MTYNIQNGQTDKQLLREMNTSEYVDSTLQDSSSMCDKYAKEDKDYHMIITFYVLF